MSDEICRGKTVIDTTEVNAIEASGFDPIKIKNCAQKLVIEPRAGGGNVFYSATPGVTAEEAGTPIALGTCICVTEGDIDNISLWADAPTNVVMTVSD